MGETLADKNQAYWNQAAQLVFKEKWVHDLQTQIFEFLTGNVEWIGLRPSSGEDGRQTKLMDYACGNGIVSRSLHHLFSKCIGVDLSDAMLDIYRATAAQLGLDESRMLAVQGDLLAPKVGPTNPQLSEEELNCFDLVAISLALHHVEDIVWATKRLAERLRPGGVLLIIDGATQASSNLPEQQAGGQTSLENHHHNHHHTHETIDPKHPAAHTISHKSFSRDQIFSLFEEAGCGESQFVLADRLSPVPGGEMQLFYARATKL